MSPFGSDIYVAMTQHTTQQIESTDRSLFGPALLGVISLLSVVVALALVHVSWPAIALIITLLASGYITGVASTRL